MNEFVDGICLDVGRKSDDDDEWLAVGFVMSDDSDGLSVLSSTTSFFICRFLRLAGWPSILLHDFSRIDEVPAKF